MAQVIPAVLAKNFDDLREKIAHFSQFVSMIQIDMCDGRFVPSVSWPMNRHDEYSISPILNEEAGLPYWDSVDFEFDLMVLNAHEQFEFFTRLGAKRIVFHFEAETKKEQFQEFLEALDMYTRENIEIGLAINNTTDIKDIKGLILHVDFVQCMGIENIGMQGEPFDKKVLDQISKLRLLYPELIISVDGSVNEETAPLLVEAGVNRLVVGSALMHSYDIKEAIDAMESLK
jgi:ribulose-phosphate 3-epimerase